MYFVAIIGQIIPVTSQFTLMALAVNIMDKRGLNNETRGQLQPKNTKVTWYIKLAISVLCVRVCFSVKTGILDIRITVERCFQTILVFYILFHEHTFTANSMVVLLAFNL